MSETNADHAAVIAEWLTPVVGLTGDDLAAFNHATAVLSAPGVVDLDPEHTAEILTWALRIAGAGAAPQDPFSGYTRRLMDAIDACPPHVREALKKVTT